MKSKKWSVAKIILIVWVVFSVLYVVYNEWTRFKVYVANQSYQQGLTDAVTQVMQQAQNCQPFPVFAGEQKVELISTACLQPPTEEPAN